MKRACIAAILIFLLAGCAVKNMSAKEWFLEGLSLLEAGDYERSIDALNKSIEIDPTHAAAYQNRGVDYSRLGNQQQALADFNKALSMNDKRVPIRDIYREMGVAYFRMDKIDDAIAAWQKGLRKAPSDPTLLNNLAVAYLQQERYDEAASSAQKAFAVDASMPEILNTMGQVSMVKKDFPKAVQYFLKAIKREPNKPNRYRNAALAYEQLKKYDKALEYANRYVDLETDRVSRQRGYEYIERLKNISGR